MWTRGRMLVERPLLKVGERTEETKDNGRR
jgi:hypothetical protein